MYIFIGTAIFAVFYLVIHFIVKAIFNVGESGIDAAKNRYDRNNGKYHESKPENLSDKYKK